MLSAAKWVCQTQVLLTSLGRFDPFTCIGFQYANDELSAEDKITVCIIENYLDFKVHSYSHYVCHELQGKSHYFSGC